MLDGNMGVAKMIANAVSEGKTRDMIVRPVQGFTE